VCIGKSFFREEAIFTITNDIKLLIGLIIIIVLFAMVHTIELKNKTLLMKNIFGVIIKKIELQKIKGRKVKYTYLPSNIPNILFRKKYNLMCRVKYTLIKGSYSFNSHILSETGLKKLLLKTRK